MSHRILKSPLIPLALALMSFAPQSQAGNNLNFSSSAQIWGNVYVSFTSPVLGDGSFTLNGGSDYKGNWTGSGNTSTGVASVNYNIPTGPGGLDPIYDLVTNGGQYGMGYSGQAETAGLKLRTQIGSQVVDNTGSLVSNTPNSSISANAYASWNQQFYIGATAARPAGSYGAILVQATLDGNFPALSDPTIGNSASASLQIGSNFTDTAGVNYNSNFNLYASASDPSWTGTQVAYKKLLFQYGTVFNLGAYQYASSSNNGAANFFNTGRITAIELPFGATLDSGAQQAGLGSLSALYGNVFNAATVDDINTNWDFGNNGGGFTPPVPEPASAALLLAGLGALSFLTARRRRD